MLFKLSQTQEDVEARQNKKMLKHDKTTNMTDLEFVDGILGGLGALQLVHQRRPQVLKTKQHNV